MAKGTTAKTSRHARAAEEPKVAFLPPLKPRPKLFMVLLVVLAVWVGFLLTLYFKTVYPHRNHTPTTMPILK